MRSERAENALAAVNERRDAELKAWMRQRGLPVRLGLEEKKWVLQLR